ncbi:MAG: amylo-alpha-1,6-glucosidase [Actinomycetota bacterium]
MTFSSAGLLTTKKGALFSCSQPNGDITGAGAEGVWLHDARHLSRLVLTVSGSQPRALWSSDDAGFEATIRLELEDRVAVTRHRRIGRDFVERISLEALEAPVAVTLQLELACDLVDLFVVRGWAEEARPPLEPEVTSDGLSYGRTGRDGLRRTTDVRPSPRPARISRGRGRQVLTWDLTLAPDQRQVVALHVSCAPGDEQFSTPVELPRAGGGERIDRALNAAGRDLAMLQTPVGAHNVVVAGIPWYVALFGRDSLLTAYALLDAAPEIARDTLLALAERQATGDDAERDAEPGKILHELRGGELARAGELMPFPYYGTVDATPLFVLVAAEYTLRTGDDATFDALQSHVDAALQWIGAHGDADGDGFVEYQRRASQGLLHQGWKDSDDAIVHADGSLAQGPLALCEVQGYVYAARTRLAELLESRGRVEEAERLLADASVLRRSFRDAFWMDERDCYALALDGDKRRVASVTSNAGHCLWSGIVDDDLAPRLAARLLGGDMFSGWGLRTLSSSSPAFDPESYHRGSVWPHDTALVAAGLHRYGFVRHAARLRAALLDVAEASPARRLPELLCGFERARGAPYVVYPTTCVPQAWAAASIFLLASLPD